MDSLRCFYAGNSSDNDSDADEAMITAAVPQGELLEQQLQPQNQEEGGQHASASSGVVGQVAPTVGATSSVGQKRKAIDCEVCGLTESKYTCPRCEIRTCCAGCVKRHKAERDCDGIRAKSKPLRMSEMNDSILQEDFTLLERISTKVDVSARNVILQRDASERRDRALQYHCRGRGIHLHLMPAGMSRHQQNSTLVQRRKDHVSIVWHVELLFGDARSRVVRRVAESLLWDQLIRAVLGLTTTQHQRQQQSQHQHQQPQKQQQKEPEPNSMSGSVAPEQPPATSSSAFSAEHQGGSAGDDNLLPGKHQQPMDCVEDSSGFIDASEEGCAQETSAPVEPSAVSSSVVPALVNSAVGASNFASRLRKRFQANATVRRELTRLLLESADSEADPAASGRAEEGGVLVESTSDGDAVEARTTAPDPEAALAYSLFMPVFPCKANEPEYYKLEPQTTLAESLRGKSLLEFPTVYVMPSTSPSLAAFKIRDPLAPVPILPVAGEDEEDEQAVEGQGPAEDVSSDEAE